MINIICLSDESLSQAAKEEQYRHLEEDANRGQPLAPHPVDPGGQKEFLSTAGTNIIPGFTGTSQVQSQNSQSNIVQADSTLPNSSSFLGLDALATAQHVTQEQLKHDKHLWTLLTSNYTEGTPVEDSGVSTGTVSNMSNKTVSSGCTSEQEYGNVYKVPQEPVSSFNTYNSSATMDTTSDKNDYSVYKFKHNITKRFSQEEKKVNTSDSSSLSSSSQDNKCKVKRKVCHMRSRSPGSFSTNYPLSDSSHSSAEVTGPLPGFILHPGGTHYVPLSINPTDAIAEIFKRDSNCRRKVFHPISIPVNFGGPRVCMKSIQEWKTESAEQSAGSGDSPGAPSSVENLSSSPMESSTSNEQEKNGTV